MKDRVRLDLKKLGGGGCCVPMTPATGSRAFGIGRLADNEPESDSHAWPAGAEVQSTTTV